MPAGMSLDDLHISVNEAYTAFDDGEVSAEQTEAYGKNICLEFIGEERILEAAAKLFGFDLSSWDADRKRKLAADFRLAVGALP
jgi:hypothetical protein